MGEEVDAIEVKMAQLNKVIDQYKEKFQLNKIKFYDIDIHLTIDQIKKLDPIDIQHKVMEWRTYSFGILIRKNELISKLGWVKANYDKYMGIQQQYVNREYGYSSDDRKGIILESDIYAQKLYRLKTDIQMEIDLLYEIPKTVNYLADAAQKIADAKWRERNGNYRN